MKNETRTELLHLLEQMSDQHPNWRLGQMICNIAGWSNSEIWDVEDDQLIASSQSHLDQLRERLGQQETSTARLNEAA